MAIEKKLICFARLEEFERQLTAGNILDYSIVFIQDAKKIWTRGTYYDCNNVIPDWNVGTGEEGYIKNRTHFRVKDELIAALDAGDGGTVVLNGTLPFLIENISLLEGQQDFREVIVSKLDTEFEIPCIGPSIKAKITHDGTNYIYEQLTTYGISNILNFYQSCVTPLQDWAIPDAIVRKTDLATINGQSLTEGGDLTIEGGETLTESDIAAMGFTKNTGTYSKPSGGIPKTDLASAVQTLLGKADTAIQSTSFGELTNLALVKGLESAQRGVVYVLPDEANGDEDDILLSRSSVKTINGESIIGEGDIAISGGVSKIYVDEAIASAITTTLNTAV